MISFRSVLSFCLKNDRTNGNFSKKRRRKNKQKNGNRKDGGWFALTVFVVYSSMFDVAYIVQFTSRVDNICYDNFICIAYHLNESWAFVCVCVRVFPSLNAIFIHLYDNQHDFAVSKLNWLFRWMYGKTFTIYSCRDINLYNMNFDPFVNL